MQFACSSPQIGVDTSAGAALLVNQSSAFLCRGCLLESGRAPGNDVDVAFDSTISVRRPCCAALGFAPASCFFASASMHSPSRADNDPGHRRFRPASQLVSTTVRGSSSALASSIPVGAGCGVRTGLDSVVLDLFGASSDVAPLVRWHSFERAAASGLCYMRDAAQRPPAGCVCESPFVEHVLL